jgi:hypothetical protein
VKPSNSRNFPGRTVMISKFMEALFTPKYPKGYTGRHRAQLALAKAASPEQAQGRVASEREVTA